MTDEKGYDESNEQLNRPYGRNKFQFNKPERVRHNLENAPSFIREVWREKAVRRKNVGAERLSTIQLAQKRGWEMNDDGTSSPQDLLYEAEEFLESHATELVFDDDQFIEYEE